jgi:hypothetical protein
MHNLFPNYLELHSLCHSSVSQVTFLTTTTPFQNNVANLNLYYRLHSYTLQATFQILDLDVSWVIGLFISFHAWALRMPLLPHIKFSSSNITYKFLLRAYLTYTENICNTKAHYEIKSACKRKKYKNTIYQVVQVTIRKQSMRKIQNHYQAHNRI